MKKYDFWKKNMTFIKVWRAQYIYNDCLLSLKQEFFFVFLFNKIKLNESNMITVHVKRKFYFFKK